MAGPPPVPGRDIHALTASEMEARIRQAGVNMQRLGALHSILDETQLVLSDRSSMTDGTDYGVQAKNVWRLADMGAKHALLRAGLGWGHMPLWMVKSDIEEGRLVRITLEGPSAGMMPFQAVYMADRLPGPAARWLLDHFSRA